MTRQTRTAPKILARPLFFFPFFFWNGLLQLCFTIEWNFSTQRGNSRGFFLSLYSQTSRVLVAPAIVTFTIRSNKFLKRCKHLLITNAKQQQQKKNYEKMREKWKKKMRLFQCYFIETTISWCECAQDAGKHSTELCICERVTHERSLCFSLRFFFPPCEKSIQTDSHHNKSLRVDFQYTVLDACLTCFFLLRFRLVISKCFHCLFPLYTRRCERVSLWTVIVWMVMYVVKVDIGCRKSRTRLLIEWVLSLFFADRHTLAHTTNTSERTLSIADRQNQWVVTVWRW